MSHSAWARVTLEPTRFRQPQVHCKRGGPQCEATMLVDDSTFLEKNCCGYRGGEHRFILNHMVSDTPLKFPLSLKTFRITSCLIRIMARTQNAIVRANVMMLSVMMMSITGRCADPEKW